MRWLGDVITALRERASAMVIGLSLAMVAVATGFISYTHISALTIHENQSWKTAHLMPLAVDGQIAIGSVILMEVKGKHRWWGLLGFVPGLAESLIANWASGWVGHNYGAALWSTVPAQAFACSTFLFELWLRYRRRTRPAAATALPHADLAALLGWPSPAAQPVAAAPPAPGLEGAPRGLVSPAAVPVTEPAAPSFPVYGPVMTLPARPKARTRPKAVPDAADERLPLPEDEDKLRDLVNSMSRNDLFRTYQVSKGGADKLRQQYLVEEEVA